MAGRGQPGKRRTLSGAETATRGRTGGRTRTPLGAPQVQARQRALVEDSHALLTERGPLGRADMVRLLSRVYRLPTAAVLQALRADPRFDVRAESIGVAHRAGLGPARAVSRAGSPLAPVNPLVYGLSLVDTDEVLLTPAGSSGEVRLRCDFVRTGAGEIWVSVKVHDAEAFTRLAGVEGAQQPGRQLQLPLRPAAPAPENLPALLVWCTTTPAHAAAIVTQVQAAWAGGGRPWRLEVVSCSPAELERRVEGERTIHRLRSRPASRLPVRTCDRCGLPLSDPTSVAAGIGPECRKYYRKEILTAVASRTTRSGPVRLGARTPKQWVRLVRGWLGEATAR